MLAVLALAEAELAEPSLAAWGRAGLSGAHLQSDEESGEEEEDDDEDEEDGEGAGGTEDGRGGAMAVDGSSSEEEDSSSDEDESRPRQLAMDSSSVEDVDVRTTSGGELALGVIGAPAADAGRGGLDEVGEGGPVRALSRTYHSLVPLRRRQPCSLWLCIWQRGPRGRRR